MKQVIHKVISFLKRVYFFIHLHLRVGIRIEGDEGNDSDDPELKE